MISKAAYAAAGTTAAVNAIGYAVSALRRTEAFFDLCGTGSYLASSIAVLAAKGQGAASLHPRQLLMLLTTSAWSLRLLVFLTNRVHRMGRDSRFDQVKQKPLVFAVFWLIQVVWVELVSLPTVAVLAADSAGMPALNWKDWIGLTVWAFGFVYEAIADQQKYVWQTRHGAHRTAKFIRTGLWAWSRYPNYFGEIVLWVGSYIIATNAFPESSTAKYLFAVSPGFITFLIMRMSGVPVQEAQARARFKNNAEYAEYVRTTSLIVPWPFGGSARKARG